MFRCSPSYQPEDFPETHPRYPRWLDQSLKGIIRVSQRIFTYLTCLHVLFSTQCLHLDRFGNLLGAKVHSRMSSCSYASDDEQPYSQLLSHRSIAGYPGRSHQDLWRGGWNERSRGEFFLDRARVSISVTLVPSSFYRGD